MSNRYNDDIDSLNDADYKDVMGAMFPNYTAEEREEAITDMMDKAL